MLILLLLLMDSGRLGGYQRADVDLIELNHHYDDLGRHCYDQVVLWRWSEDYRRYDVADWTLVERLEQYPTRGHTGLWIVIVDKSTSINGRWMIVSSMYRETWSFIKDPERMNKRYFNEKYRVGLIPR